MTFHRSHVDKISLCVGIFFKLEAFLKIATYVWKKP